MIVVGTIQNYLFLALSLVVVGMCAFALFDALRRPGEAFSYAEKRTKGFWAGILALALLLAFLGIPPPLGRSGLIIFLVLAAVPAGIYLADVRPAVRHYRDNRGGGGSPW